MGKRKRKLRGGKKYRTRKPYSGGYVDVEAIVASELSAAMRLAFDHARINGKAPR